MCKPPPGPRCAAHAAADLRAANARAAAAVAAYREAQGLEGNEALTWDEQRGVRVDIHTTREQARHAVQQADAAQAVYDSTPTGQRALERLLRVEEATADQDPVQRSNSAVDSAQRHASNPAGTAAALRARLTAAKAHRAAVMRQWKASSAYTAERLSDATRTAITAAADGEHADAQRAREREAELRREWIRRSAAEHGVPLPPSHPKARRAWEASDSYGMTWSAVAAFAGPHAALLTYTDPDVHSAALAHRQNPTDERRSDRLRAAHAHALPHCLLSEDTPTHAMYVAAWTGHPWRVHEDTLVDGVIRHAPTVVDHAAHAAAGAHVGDQWHVQRVVGPLAVASSQGDVFAADSGFVCVRSRDRIWRVFTAETYAQRFSASTGSDSEPGAGSEAEEFAQ